MDGDWPAAADGPRCERCGQAHLPLPAGGSYACGSCGWPLAAPAIQQARQARSRRIANVLLAAAATAVVGLLLGMPSRRHRQDPSSSPSGPADGVAEPGVMPSSGPPAGTGMGPPMGFPAMDPSSRPPRPGSAGMAAGPVGGGPPGFRGPWAMGPMSGMAGPSGAQGMPGASSPMLGELERTIAELERAPLERRQTYAWNVALADNYWFYARELAGASPEAPRRAPEGEDRVHWRMRMDRFVARHPESLDYLRKARNAYERAVDFALTPEQRGRARQRLGDVCCTMGDYAEGLRHVEEARKLVGDDARSAFLRTRCEIGLRAHE